MTDFFDWLTAADSGLAADRLAETFRLTQKEMREATEALAPAFTQALQQRMSDPAAWTELSMRFAPFMQANRLGTGEAPVGPEAFRLADSLFGSQDLAATVARQASLASGVAPDTVQKLMASLSVMTMETMVRMMMTNIARNQPAGMATGDYGGAVAEMMRRGANAVEAMSRPSDSYRAGPRNNPAPSHYLDQLFADALRGSLPWMPPPGTSARPAETKAAADRPDGDETPAGGFDPFLPFSAMLGGFARGMQASRDAAGSGDAPPADSRLETAPPSSEPAPPLADMVSAGQRMQEDYAREMLTLFERYGSPGKRDDTQP